MKKIAALVSGLLFMGIPMLVFADTLASQDTQMQQLTAVLASLEAHIAALSTPHAPVCAVATSKATVKVGERFALAWGSVGATGDKNIWPQNGSEILAFSQAGTFKYSFTFYGEGAVATTCTANIIVTSVE